MTSKTKDAVEERKQLLGQFSLLIAQLIARVNTSEEELRKAKEEIARLVKEDADNADEILEDNPEIKELINQAASATPSSESITTVPAQIDPPHLTEAAPVKGGVGANELTPDLTVQPAQPDSTSLADNF